MLQMAIHTDVPGDGKSSFSLRIRPAETFGYAAMQPRTASV